MFSPPMSRAEWTSRIMCLHFQMKLQFQRKKVTATPSEVHYKYKLAGVGRLLSGEELTVKYTTLYTDESGESHFRDVEVGFESVTFAPPAPPVGLSEYSPVSQLVFFKITAGWFGDWHPAPKRQFFCCLSGEFEIEASDGETRIFRQGEIFLLEDTSGKGHKSKVTGKEDFVAAVVQLAQ